MISILNRTPISNKNSINTILFKKNNHTLSSNNIYSISVLHDSSPKPIIKLVQFKNKQIDCNRETSDCLENNPKKNLLHHRNMF